MNFGGGGAGGSGMPPFGNGMPPFMGGMPMFPPGMPTMPPGMAPFGAGMPYGMGGVPAPGFPAPHMHQPQPMQSTGQGPLGDAPARIGANGLYEAPEPEGPEEHEGVQYMKLNPTEELKYGELWAEASAGEEKVGGKEASALLSRAAKVSKSQFRLIWEIVDHRKEGELDRSQFFIALRLIAIAQRGAEIGMKGLRNFVGIQLIPNIRPPDPPPTPEPTHDQQHQSSAANPGGPGGTQKSQAFSWTVGPDVIARYDNYFAGLDASRAGFIDGKTGVSFFGKSGLPRPTLKRVWQLADITCDGRLDLQEFRLAMHMVANLRMGRLAERELPPALDPSGPYWLRLEEEPEPTPPYQPEIHQPHRRGGNMSGSSPHQRPSAIPDGHGSPVMYDQMHSHGMSASTPPTHAVPSSIHAEQNGSFDLLSGAVPALYVAQTGSPVASSSPRRTSSVSLPHSDGDREESRALRDKLRREQEDAARAHQELEEMKAEMERLRLEKASMERPPPKQERSEVEEMRHAYQEMVQAKAKAEEDAAQARAEALRLREVAKADIFSGSARDVPRASSRTSDSIHGNDGMWNGLSPRAKPLSSAHQTSAAARPSPANRPVHAVDPLLLQSYGSSGPQAAVGHSPASAGASPRRHPMTSAESPLSHAQPDGPTLRHSPVRAGGSNQTKTQVPERTMPSPKATARKPTRTQRLVSDDSMSESDDDDFWGSSSAPKPSLGKLGGGAPDNAQAGGASTGVGNDLDEWAF